MSNQPSRYDVFVSYSRRDSANWVQRVVDVLTESGLKVFYDIENIIPGSDFVRAIEDSLRNSKCLLVFVGPSGLGQHQQREVSHYLNLRKKIIPVLLPGAVLDPLSDLSRFNAVELRSESNWESVVMRIAAFLQTEQSDDIYEERRRAGDRLRDVGELRQSLEVYHECLAIAERQGNRESTTEILSRIASVQFDLGLYADAEPIMRRALGIDEECYGADHPNVAVSLNNLASLLQHTGDVGTALSLMKRALAIQERALGAEHPSYAISLGNLASLSIATGNIDEARGLLLRKLTIDRSLCRIDPSNIQSQRDLSVSLNRLGDIHVAVGDLQAARAYFQEALSISRQVAGSNPSNIQSQRDLSVSLNRLGDLHVAVGDLQAAHAYFQEALSISRRVAESDPSNIQWQRDLSVSLNRLGDTRVAGGDLQGARAYFEEALSLSSRMAGAEPSSSQWQWDLSISFNRLGNLAESQGNLPEAHRLFADSLRIAQSLAESDPGNAAWQRDLWISNVKMANLLERQADSRAEYHWRKAHDILAAMVQAGLHLSPADLAFLKGLRARIGD